MKTVILARRPLALVGLCAALTLLSACASTATQGDPLAARNNPQCLSSEIQRASNPRAAARAVMPEECKRDESVVLWRNQPSSDEEIDFNRKRDEDE